MYARARLLASVFAVFSGAGLVGLELLSVDDTTSLTPSTSKRNQKGLVFAQMDSKVRRLSTGLQEDMLMGQVRSGKGRSMARGVLFMVMAFCAVCAGSFPSSISTHGGVGTALEAAFAWSAGKALPPRNAAMKWSDMDLGGEGDLNVSPLAAEVQETLGQEGEELVEIAEAYATLNIAQKRRQSNQALKATTKLGGIAEEEEEALTRSSTPVVGPSFKGLFRETKNAFKEADMELAAEERRAAGGVFRDTKRAFLQAVDALDQEDAQLRQRSRRAKRHYAVDRSLPTPPIGVGFWQ